VGGLERSNPVESAGFRVRGVTRTLSVMSFSNPEVNAFDASSRCKLSPQFLERDSAKVRVYSWTFALRWVSRLRIAAMIFRALRIPVSATPGKMGRVNRYPVSPSSWTLSHKLRISSQFSPVRFSSVVFTGAKREQAFHVSVNAGPYRLPRRRGSLLRP
jgi:hypothetical protein